MKNVRLILSGLSLLLAILFSSCSDPVTEQQTSANKDDAITTTDNSQARLPGPGGGVLMQAFYWDVPAGGNWYDSIKDKIPSWDAAGISAIWLPPVSKAQNGAYSMGYDPADYFDFGDYNQHGSVETRFGNKAELVSLINTAHSYDIDVYADIVLNHNSGGALEPNPYTGTNTYTDFNPASGKFYRSASDFHPNSYATYDEGIFGGFPDLSHSAPYVQDWLWNRADGVGKYYRDSLGFDGWRFDYVKGFGGWVVKEWMNNVGGFAVGEYWDGNAQLLQDWVNATNRTSSAFDFACYYKMDEAFDGNDLTKLQDDMLWKRDAYKSVTFVTNHDTDIIGDKMHAYAYIMTHEGYPTVFYNDFEQWLDKDKLINLIWIHNNKAVGSTSIQYADNDEYIARRNGSPGLIVYLNDSNVWVERWVQTNWSTSSIKDYTGNSNWQPTTQTDKWVKIQCPPNSYSVWSPL
ncbi:alpha-amylase [Fulvivirga sediminis]|uniref:Alpha-amylase n=1 Tax=Fulvivirga sediminis TaxID=2803949 RepID=A0A937F980_9BACT|nr:alpha-amylase [Fulvivirga sediminis]MBL3657337.1 alpha-amylase [Fulvivirga sediminis]